MSRRVRRAFVAIAILASQASPAASGAVEVSAATDPACVVSVGWNHWPPYAARGADDAPEGLDVELVETLLGDLGCRPEWRELPWSRIVKGIDQGLLDMAPWATRTAERERFAWFSDMYMYEPSRLITLRGRLPETEIADFEALASSLYTIGVELGAVYTPRFGELRAAGAFGDRLHVVARGDLLVPLLLSGRVDLIIDTAISAHSVMRGRPEPRPLAYVPFFIPGGETHYIVSMATRDRGWVEDLNAALADMLNDGRYDRIVSPHDPTLSLRPDQAPGRRAGPG